MANGSPNIQTNKCCISIVEKATMNFCPLNAVLGLKEALANIGTEGQSKAKSGSNCIFVIKMIGFCFISCRPLMSQMTHSKQAVSRRNVKFVHWQEAQPKHSHRNPAPSCFSKDTNRKHKD